MEEGINARNYYKNETNDEVKEVECPDYASPVEMEEGLSDIKDDKNGKYDGGGIYRIP